ncbi:MAG: trigger factor [Candidatus Eremiobacteraeota bacterium]|nr:trigger factor [Candidatus Eremiobacteraeota bacterium]
MSAATVKHLDPTQVELEITIDPGDLASEQERAFRELAKNVRMPGFRPGKVPRKLFEAQYGTSAIHERAMEAVVGKAYPKALEENDLDPVDAPQMELLPDEDGLPVRVRATVFVRPQIELGTYKGIELTGSSTAVSETDVENALTELRKDGGTLVPVDRPVAIGDVPTIDYEGKIDGVPFDGGKAEGEPTEILEERFIPGFASGIVGMNAGETKDVEAHFPDDYANAELAGKTAVFTITVHENKTSELPALDDDFAKRFAGDDATVATLRDEMRVRLEANARNRQRRELSGTLMEKLIAAHDVALPPVMVDRETESLESESKSYVERAGIEWSTYLNKQGKSEEELRAGFRTDAEQRVKGSLLIEAIAKAENIVATNADVEAEIAQLSRQYGRPREDILRMLQSNVNALVDGIVRTKTLEFLLDHAAIVETPAETPAEAATAGDGS